MPHSALRTCLFTALALIAFAANSLLCRLAIGSLAIDAASFTIIRIVSGAAMLWVLVMMVPTVRPASSLSVSTVSPSKSSSSIVGINAMQGGSWLASLMLFIYAAGFSLAYLTLDTGTGALILFGSVQVTLVVTSLYLGERLGLIKWLGLIIALLGLAYLLLPAQNATSAPISPLGFILMAAAGIAWGGYTLIGKGSKTPLADTTGNFIKAVPMTVLLLPLLFYYSTALSFKGVVLAMSAGALTSGLGYSIWYLVLPNLSRIQASVLQLLVPVLATIGGIIFLQETLTTQLLIAMTMTLFGIFMVIYTPKVKLS